jgi:predicted ATPase
LENLFTGRTAEHHVLVGHYRRAAAGQPQAVILRGEAGIGKTRLAREFLTWAVAQGAEALPGSAFESGTRIPYQPLIEAFRPVLERENAPEDLLADAWLVGLSQLFPELLNRYPDLPSPDLEAPAARTRLFESLTRLTVALTARAPLVLFMDDLHWSDRATLDWLQYAARQWRQSAARILLLVSLRSEALYPTAQPPPADLIEWLAQVAREVETDDVELKPLGERDTVGLVLSLLAPPAADFAQWVYGETRGQPFYLMETLKDLLDRGALHPKRGADGQWAFEVDAEHDLGKAVRVPSTVGAVIRSRLNRLSPNAFGLLAAGAVLEQRLTFEHLCGVSNLAADAALPALDELVSGRLLLEVAQPGVASTYAFAHHMIRDVVYTEAGDARRRLFHQRALGILEAAQDPPAALAHHALAAGLAGPAFRHSLTAGREALRLFVASEAIVHFENARQLAREALTREALPLGPEPVSHMRELYLQLGRAYELSGQHERVRAVYEEMEQAYAR